MSGRPKKRLDYAGWSVDIFDGDTKIDELIDSQGWVGFAIYFYLCQKAYGTDGYFYRWTYSNAATTARRMSGGIGSETVKNTVGLCLRIGLFDSNLFDRDGILTSRGIQRRFYDAIQKRLCKDVVKDYWLLGPEESKGLVYCTQDADLSLENAHVLPEDAHVLPEDTQSKVKESKGEESKYDDADSIDNDNQQRGKPEISAQAPSGSEGKKKYGEYGWVRLSADEYNRLLADMGRTELERCITYVDESAQSNGNRNKWRDWNLVLRKCHKNRWGVQYGQTPKPAEWGDRI